ncbi:GOLPH3/VPS74 family protein [Longispora albida]|uniref:GOLPH3/VPS74 family protein n=1 Tax=Longispora albida TaxID=203523 RepID=UPI00035C2336|nr:GPP34 family phosphoprotein [Longispora albida]
MLLADEFFLIAHDDLDGRRRLHGRATGLGLAGALLGELMLFQCLTLENGLLTVVDRRPPGEPLAAGTLQALLDSPEHRDVRTWLAYLSQDSTDTVAQRLAGLGFLHREESRVLWRKTVRYVPVDGTRTAWPAPKLRLALTEGRPMDLPEMALAVLVEAAGLLETVIWDGKQSGARRYLRRISAALPAPLRELAGHVEAAIGDAVLAHRG